MPRIMPDEIRESVRSILKNSREQKQSLNPFLTAYQILDRVNKLLQARLIRERGIPGKESGNRYSAATLVSNAARMIEGVEVAYLDVSDIQVECAGKAITAGNPHLALYRLGRKCKC